MPTIFNDHNVYVLGAGFSAARGLPLTTDFLFKVRDAHPWLVANGRAAEADAVQKVLEFRLASTSAAYRIPIDLENIEELFSLASAAGDSLSRDIRIAIAATLDFCAAIAAEPTTSFRMTPDGPRMPSFQEGRAESTVPGASDEYRVPTYDFVIAGLLGRLGEPRETATHTFVSFNYDLLIDETLSRLEIPFSYGFETGQVTLDPSAHRLTLSDTPKVLLLKLHGSTNCSLSIAREDQLTVYGAYDNLRRAGRAPELVPPTDLHFEYLLAGGLRQNISLREVVFVNPDRTTIEQRAKELFGDLNRRPIVRIVESKAAQFVGQGMLPTTTWSIGRPLHTGIQSVAHPF